MASSTSELTKAFTGPVPEPSERSPLIAKHHNAGHVYSVSTSSSDPEDEDTTAPSPISSIEGEDEEALVGRSSALDGAGASANEATSTTLSTTSILWIVLPMMLAVFISNADATLVMATHAVIASEFMALESSSWLFTGFLLASTATQTTFGQLSDIFGRKPVIMLSYAVFGLGCFISGVAHSMPVAIVGRVISGAVSAGTSVLVSLFVTDIFPMREVATWRSYINVVAVIGRCVGGPLGGWLADVVGWRLSFLGQTPLFILALVLASISLPNSKPRNSAVSKSSKLQQVDFAGSILLAAFLILLLLPIQLGGNLIPWDDAKIPIFLSTACIALALFVAVEKWRATSPLLPLSLFGNRHTVSCFVVMALAVAAQIAMMFSVPLYFQVTKRMSSTAAGVRLLPAVLGNAVGGIFAGIFMKKTGSYKSLIFLAFVMTGSAYALLILRWHGNTNWLESLYILPGGLGTGIAGSAIFIAVQSSVDKAHIAPAVSMVYLMQGFGSVCGIAIAGAVYQSGLKATLDFRLKGLQLDADLRSEIISQAVASVDYIDQTKGDVANAIVESYVDGLRYSHYVSLLAAILALALTVMLRQYKM